MPVTSAQTPTIPPQARAPNLRMGRAPVGPRSSPCPDRGLVLGLLTLGPFALLDHLVDLIAERSSCKPSVERSPMGGETGAMMRLHLRPGQKLSIMDNDVDPHQMMELAGPMHVRMGAPMMMNHGMTLSFMKKRAYRLGTKTIEMPGGGMDVKTIGPDNRLRLVVTVA